MYQNSNATFKWLENVSRNGSFKTFNASCFPVVEYLFTKGKNRNEKLQNRYLE